MNRDTARIYIIDVENFLRTTWELDVEAPAMKSPASHVPLPAIVGARASFSYLTILQEFKRPTAARRRKFEVTVAKNRASGDILFMRVGPCADDLLRMNYFVHFRLRVI